VVTAAELAVLVADVEDPELPHVTIGDLGIVRDVTIDGSTATIVLTPTYTGCPAVEQIRDDVAAVVRANGYDPVVAFTLSPAWSTDWITERGRARLTAAGIAPPHAVADVSVAVTVACPRCGSRPARLVSEFSGTSCKAAYVCGTCAEPFEAFKAL
jgi:ring-1,2-phenylacetyl-CoA epoxidase subunit PaaD